MGRTLEDYLVENHVKGAYLIKEEEHDNKSKDEYIKNAKPGLIVAFRLFFESKKEKKLTKVISGKIIENDEENKKYIVETKNELKYGVPYDAVVWIKTGSRWPKGVYNEMKQGSVEVDEDAFTELGGFQENAADLHE